MDKIIIFGASGDLAKKKILPAISKIYNKNVKVYGYARSDFTNNFSEEIKKFYEYENDFPDNITYIKGEYTCLEPLKDIIDENTLIYLSLPPHVHHTVLSQLKTFNFGIVCIEKPFGTDTESFEKLMEFKSDKVKFIDHYLLKPMMIAIPEISNKIPELFKKLNRNNIKSVDCHFLEKILAEGRSYFDKNGIVKDVMQNHLVEMLASILCDGKDALNDSRIDFIKDAYIDNKKYIFGQYTQYSTELGHSSNTETFSAFKCGVNSDNWKGVPFIMAAGKGVSKKASEIRFNIREDKFGEFLELNHNINRENKIDSMTVVFNIAPENEISIVETSSKGSFKTVIFNSNEIKEIARSKMGSGQDYEIIFGSTISGKVFPSVTFEEARELWRMFDEILKSEKHLEFYETGVEMPLGALNFIKNEEKRQE